jgi:hypothetical protein
MAAFSGPNLNSQQPVTVANINGIVADQLALYFDAARGLSYSGSGAVWGDLSGNGRNATFYNSSNTTYINGAEDSTHVLNSSVTGPLRAIGSLWGPCMTLDGGYPAGSDYYSTAFDGTIAIIKVYAKQLSAAEVTQNYNNLRRRFGL